MKKLFSILLLILILPLAACAEGEFKEGKQFDVIADVATSKPEVKEFFSFYCGHCFQFEPIMQSIEHKLPEGTSFKKMHVDFLRAASPEIQETLARAYLVAVHLNKGDQIASAIFNHIHRNRGVFASDDDIRQFMLINDIDAESYDKAMNSFSVRGGVKQMKKEQTELSDRRVLTGVPTIIVNGKYRVNLAGLDSKNIEQELQQLIDFLLTKDAKGA